MRWLFVVLVGCGRIGFDLPAGGDAASGASGLPAGGETCANATPLAFGSSGTASIGAANDVNSGLCPDGVDIVYRVSSPADARHQITITATFTGAIVHSATCPPVSAACSGFFAGLPTGSTTDFVAGTSYLIIEKSSGTGTTFDFTLQ